MLNMRDRLAHSLWYSTTKDPFARNKRQGISMITCALVGSADFNKEHFLAQDFDFVVAVDGGYRHLYDIGVTPDVVLGDFDSLGYVPEHEHVISFPVQKDASDIELALEYATDGGYHRLLVYGCLGGRLDLTYAVTQLVARFTKEDNQIFAIGVDTIVTALSGDEGALASLSFSEKATGTFSAFAFDAEVTGIDEVGFEYPLDQATLFNTQPLGVSNAFTGKPACISVGEGTLVVFFPVSAWNELLTC